MLTIHNKKVQNIMIYSVATTIATTFGIVLCKGGNIPTPIFNNKLVVYNNDVIAYSSLDQTISILEREDSRVLEKLNQENLNLYSSWIQFGDNWSREITTFELSMTDINQMKELVRLNATEEEWLQLLDTLEKRESSLQTSIGEPMIKDAYFEFMFVDDTKHKIPAPIKEMPIGMIAILGFNLGAKFIAERIILNISEKENNSKQIKKYGSI